LGRLTIAEDANHSIRIPDEHPARGPNAGGGTYTSWSSWLILRPGAAPRRTTDRRNLADHLLPLPKRRRRPHLHRRGNHRPRRHRRLRHHPLWHQPRGSRRPRLPRHGVRRRNPVRPVRPHPRAGNHPSNLREAPGRRPPVEPGPRPASRCRLPPSARRRPC